MTALLPIRFTIQHLRYTGDGLTRPLPDDNTTDFTSVSVKAYGWYPRATELVPGGQVSYVSMQETLVDLFLPVPIEVGLMDRFVLDGATFEVVGRRDFNNGPFGWRPGIVVELKRLTGN